jgi:hypothetical protein
MALYLPLLDEVVGAVADLDAAGDDFDIYLELVSLYFGIADLTLRYGHRRVHVLLLDEMAREAYQRVVLHRAPERRRPRSLDDEPPGHAVGTSPLAAHAPPASYAAFGELATAA